MAKLFQRDKSVISRHIKHIFEEGELERPSVVADSATTAADGKTYQVEYYNLDVIISVGYRVKSHRGTQFRIWATQRLREYLVKGFALDDERLKRGGGGQLLRGTARAHPRHPSSEKVFWRKVLDIYATSIDYDPHVEHRSSFFTTVQNKMHWAAHGHTAAEIIAARADATKPNMGLTNWTGMCRARRTSASPRTTSAPKNSRRSTASSTPTSSSPRLQAHEPQADDMADWIRKLDDFLRMSEYRHPRHADG